jgi:hypothetical protein
LALGEEIGSGGQGKVYQLPRSPHLVYKAYERDTVLPQVDRGALETMVAFPATLSATDRTALLARAAWPVEVVDESGALRGFTMPQVPARFHTRIRLSSSYGDRLGQTQLLLNDGQFLRDRDITVDDRFRLELLVDVAESLELFHRLGVTVGDFSPNNLLFARSGRPRCYFIDCDAMQVNGRSVLPQIETNDWQVPVGGEALATPQSDSYKFALLVVRLFAGEQSSHDSSPVRRAGGEVHDLVVRALSGSPAQRPDMAEWRRGLTAARPRQEQPKPEPRPKPKPKLQPKAKPVVLPPTLPRRRKRGKTIFSAVVLAIVLVYAIANYGKIVNWVQDVTTDHAQVQADAFAQTLASAGPTRTKVKAAVTNLMACKQVKPAATVLARASKERQRSLVRARGLTVGDLARGDELKSQLVAAFSHSKAADDAYRKWALALAAKGCRAAKNGPERKRGDAESKRATAAKKQVAGIWNDVASGYGHPTVVYTNI